MYHYEYYTTKHGEQPVRDWIVMLPLKERAVIWEKIQKLCEEGLKLLGTELLTTIKGYTWDFYELRGRKLRIGVYLDRPKSMFILLHGWRKKQQRQPRDIMVAYKSLIDYLSD